ncbi:MAG: glycosyltransferase [Paenibacillus sp.]|nr:glycosyltransferase [Paenibacillus sp.]
MDAKAKVSIVIPFYNCQYIDLAVESALAQSYTDIEIIVVDDGSTKHIEKLTPYKNDIIYIRKTNGGTASALNRGIMAATGSYFAWLSSDDQFHPDKIKRQMELIQNSGTFFCHTAFYYINEQGERLSEVVAPPMNRVQLIETLMKGCPVNGSSVLLNMKVFYTVGLFNESFLYTHDYELWLRILPYYEWAYIKEPLLDYRVHAAMGSVIHGKQQTQEIKRVQAKHAKALLRLLRKEQKL